MNRNIKGSKQQVKLRKRVEKLIHENTTAIRKIPPTDMRNLFEELQIYQVELENINNELRKAQEELQESENRLNDFMNSATDACVILDSELNILRVNKIHMDMFHSGMDEEDLIGKNLLEIVPNLKKTGRFNDFMKVLEIGTPFYSDDIVPHKNFGNRYISLKAFKMSDGLGTIVRDITERKEAKKALQKSEYQYRLVAENATGIIWVLNFSTMTFDYVSPSVERNTGFSPTEAKAVSMEETLTPQSLKHVTEILKEELSNENKKGIDKNRTRTLEVEQLHKGGGYAWSEITVSFLRDENGNPTSIICVTRDISKRKKIEFEKKEKIEQLQQAFTEIKTLQGMLPICLACKSIRNDAGYWQKIEGYIEKHTAAQFTHSICPKCAKRLYPDLDVRRFDILRKKYEEE